MVVEPAVPCESASVDGITSPHHNLRADALTVEPSKYQHLPNVTAVRHWSYTSNAADQLTLVQPASGAPTTLSYDLNGNLTLEKAGTVVDSYTWDPENRLTVWNSGAYSTLQTFAYDPSDLRVRRQLPTRTDNLLNDDQNVAQIVTGDPVVYQHLPGIWGSLFSVRYSNASKIVVPDFQGHSRLMVNSSQAITETAIYDAWGAEVLNMTSGKLDFRSWGAVGYFRDSPTRSYVRARELRRDWGRWLSVDPIGFEGGQWNLYGYVGNSPVVRVDASGLQAAVPEDPDCPSCGWFWPRSRVGRIFIDCNCKGKGIRILPEDGDLVDNPTCGIWIAADAVIFNGKTYKINGQTCVTLSCPPDDAHGCYSPRFTCLRCSFSAIHKKKCRWPNRVDLCKEFCYQSCPPLAECRGYSR